MAEATRVRANSFKECKDAYGNPSGEVHMIYNNSDNYVCIKNMYTPIELRIPFEFLKYVAKDLPIICENYRKWFIKLKENVENNYNNSTPCSWVTTLKNKNGISLVFCGGTNPIIKVEGK